MTPGRGSDTASPASIPRRLAAFGVDYLALAGYILALWLVSAGLTALGVEPEAAFAGPARGHVVGFIVLTLPVVLYFALWEASARQATPGKRAMGLVVVSAAGGRLPLLRSLVRTALKFLPWELAHATLWRIPGWPGAVETIPAGAVVAFGAVWLLVALYLLLPVWSAARQTPYDRASGALVLRPSPSRRPMTNLMARW